MLNSNPPLPSLFEKKIVIYSLCWIENRHTQKQNKSEKLTLCWAISLIS